ncbi:hypothetical protein PMIN03_007160 [Paraphaeosphaeria minitans]
MKGLTSLFKHSDRNKGTEPEATSSHPEIRLGPAQLLDQRRKQERASSSDFTRDTRSAAHPSAPSSHAALTYPSNRSSDHHPASVNGDRSVGTTGHAARSPSLSERGDDTIGDDYRAYMGAISPGSVASKASKNSTGAEFFSLGNDSRPRTGNSEMKHAEYIADRNIERHVSSSSWHSSLGSQNAGNQFAQDHNACRQSIAVPIECSGPVPSPSPAKSVLGSLGTEVATEGDLVDRILPHIEDPHARPYDRKNWPTRIARDESHLSSNDGRHVSGDDDTSDGKRGTKKRDGNLDVREAILGGSGDYDLKAALDGVVDLNHTEDVVRDVQWAPAVTQEVVKPHQHEVIEELIYREIHNHDIYRYIQPVYQTEILPARHFVNNTNNELVEVSADQLPECTGAKQRWAVVRGNGDREKPTSHPVRSALPRRELKILSDKTYTTPEGYERRETTILHPPELEDLSNYGGPVVPIEFLHHPAPVDQELKESKKIDRLYNDRQFTMEGLAIALPAFHPGSSSSFSSSSSSSRAPTGSSASSPASKRLSIPRKPVLAPPSC